MENSNQVKYAGYFSRLLALMADLFALSFVLYLLHFLLPLDETSGAILVIGWFYFALMISNWGTTIGGKILGIKIVDEHGDKLSFLKASIRFLLSVLPFVLYLYLRNMQHMMIPPPSAQTQMLPQLIFILPPFLMFLTKKRQMIHDLVVKSVVLDVNKSEESASRHPLAHTLRSIIRVVGTLLFLVVAAYVTFYTAVFYQMGKSSENAYNASFHQTYSVNDHNDSRIIFYKQELEQSSKAFIEAEEMYDIFAADTKKDLALNCIQAALKEHNVSDWIAEGSRFRKNARNIYANNESLIAKAKKNESYMGHHFYDFDLNDVNHIVDKLANIWQSSKNRDTCNRLVPVDALFDDFMLSYIPNREEALSYYENEYKHAKPTGTLNKSFYQKEMEQTRQWLKILHEKYPNIEEKIAVFRQKQREKLKEESVQKAKKDAQRKNELIWLAAQKNNLYGENHYKNTDLNLRNEKGQTPLMIAVKNGYYKVVQEFSYGRLDVLAKDHQGKTAYHYIPIATTKEEGILQSRVLGALTLAEVRQALKDKAKIVQYAYDYDDNMLQFTIKGAECQKFVFPKNTQCMEEKVPAGHAIFKAIKAKDTALFDKLLPTVKDLSVKNKSNYTPLWASIHYRNYDALVKLLDAGANMYELDQNGLKTPVYWAALINDSKLLKVLLQHGADVNSKDLFGNVALSTAMYKCNNFEAVEILLDHGADPSLKDKRGKTVLEKKSVFCKNKAEIEKMRALLKKGAKQ